MYTLSTFGTDTGHVSFEICISEVIRQITNKREKKSLQNLITDKYKENGLKISKELERCILNIENSHIPAIITEIINIENKLGNEFDNYCDLLIENDLTKNVFWITDTFTEGKIFPKTYSCEKLHDSFQQYIRSLKNM